MKKLEKIKNDYAKEFGYSNFEELIWKGLADSEDGIKELNKVISDIAQRYHYAQIKNLSPEERMKIAKEEMDRVPLYTIGWVAACKIADHGLKTGAKNGSIGIETDHEGERYKLTLTVNWEKIKS